MTEGNEQKFTMQWSEDEGVMHIKVFAYLDEECSQALYAQAMEEAAKRGGRVPVLVDVSRADSASFAARKVLVELFKNGKYSRVAFCGYKTFDRVFINFIVRAASAKNVGFYKEEEEAMRWLKEK